MRGAFDKENGSHEGNMRKTVLKSASQMFSFYTTFGKIEDEPLIFYYHKQSSFLQLIIVSLSCTKSAHNNGRSLG